MAEEVLNLINAILLHAMVLPTNAFPILYLARSKPVTSAGKAVLISTSALALLVDVVIYRRWLGFANPLVEAIVTTIVFSLILAGSIYKLAVLLKDQQQARKQQPTD